MPVGEGKLPGFSDNINDFKNPEKLPGLYDQYYVNSDYGIEALVNFRVVKNRNIEIQIKEPVKFKVEDVDAETAFDAVKNLLNYSQPKYIDKKFTLSKSLVAARQYSNIDELTPELMKAEVPEISKAEHILKRQCIVQALEKDAPSIPLAIDNWTADDAYDILFNFARELDINLNNLVVICRDDLLQKWKKDVKLQTGSSLTIAETLKERDITMSGAFKDDVYGITFIGVPPKVRFTDGNGNTASIKYFENDETLFTFFELVSEKPVVEGVIMEHTPLRTGTAGVGLGKGAVPMLEYVTYFDVNVYDNLRTGKVTTTKSPAPKNSQQVYIINPNQIQNVSQPEYNSTKQQVSKVESLRKVISELKVSDVPDAELENILKNNNDSLINSVKEIQERFKK